MQSGIQHFKRAEKRRRTLNDSARAWLFIKFCLLLFLLNESSIHNAAARNAQGSRIPTAAPVFGLERLVSAFLTDVISVTFYTVTTPFAESASSGLRSAFFCEFSKYVPFSFVVTPVSPRPNSISV